jgi:hypothetical protein
MPRGLLSTALPWSAVSSTARRSRLEREPSTNVSASRASSSPSIVTALARSATTVAPVLSRESIGTVTTCTPALRPSEIR